MDAFDSRMIILAVVEHLINFHWSLMHTFLYETFIALKGTRVRKKQVWRHSNEFMDLLFLKGDLVFQRVNRPFYLWPYFFNCFKMTRLLYLWLRNNFAPIILPWPGFYTEWPDILIVTWSFFSDPVFFFQSDQLLSLWHFFKVFVKLTNKNMRHFK